MPETPLSSQPPFSPASAHGAYVPPKWSREIQRFLGVKSQFILSGNIYDIFPIPLEGRVTTGTLAAFLRQILAERGYKLFFRYEPFQIQTLIGPQPGEPAPEGLDIPAASSVVTLARLGDFAAALASYREPSAVLINYSSRIPTLCAQEFEHFLYRLFRQSLEAKARGGRYNLIFWAIDKDNDLPAWYANSRVMLLPIPKPDHYIRRHIILAAGRSIKGYGELLEKDPARHHGLVNRFIDLTGGLNATEIVSIASLAAQDQLDFTRIADAVRHYKLGVPDNPWDKLDRGVISGGQEFLKSRVIGQDQAVGHSLDIIKRSILDLSGSQFSLFSQKPKGVLFFAGPTGVGKTELAKSVTELIFGSPENYIRFDMSEFNQPHSDQRLMGAPPGYVGYEVGGELTNSIKQRPFTLILFDEIEKAHPRIMDVFLQILDDGRLTSGRGETVYFYDAVLVFTSNLGVYRETEDGRREALINPADNYGVVKDKITNAIREFFTYKLNRPEILNRIGNNIVVFDFIRPKEAFAIYKKMLGNVILRLADAQKIGLTLDAESERVLGELVTRDLAMGGRGIGNALEERFVNPLSRELYNLGAQARDRFACSVVPLEGGECALCLERVSTRDH
ncbi:MAG: AAA family ATPase [Deltaproteobacteria bacterium]|jgi:hypothetical protein|nr:AAA family ATPase [Deltaproteobacteria bacterium]